MYTHTLDSTTSNRHRHSHTHHTAHRTRHALQASGQVIVLPPPAPVLRAEAVDAAELLRGDGQQAAEKILVIALGVQPVGGEVQRRVA